MALRFNQSEELPSPLNKFSERDLRWLWRVLTLEGAPLPIETNVPKSERPSVLANMIKSDQEPDSLIQYILDQHRSQLVDTKWFDWIDSDGDRQLAWLLHKTQHLARQPFGYQPITVERTPREERKDSIILMLDLWDETIENKHTFLSNKRNEWADIRTPDHETKWIDPKNSAQLKWAWSYLNKQQVSVALPSPVDNRDYLTCILATIDNMSYRNFAEKQLFLEKMKKTWSQKKYRDSGKAKKQHYMPLTKDTRDKLSALSEGWGMKPHEVVERLIQDASN
jgi:hypothetical protein